MIEYSKRLGRLTPEQFQRALERYNLGNFVKAEPIPFGDFGQNALLESTHGKYVLRGAPHYPDQFFVEQFFVDLFHEHTKVAVPWPYLIDEATDIFGWSYVIMPYMAGLQLANPEVRDKLAWEDRVKIARAMGKNLATMQTLTWSFSGQYDLQLRTIKPFVSSYGEWVLSRLRQNLRISMQYNDRTDEADAQWVENLIASSQEALNDTFQPCFVDHDYKEANVVVTLADDKWTISGVFDLMNAHFGDGEAGLARLMFMYIIEDRRLAEAYIQAYVQNRPPRPGFKERYVLYMLDNCLMLWSYFQSTQPGWLDKTLRFRDWITPYIFSEIVRAL